MCAYSVVHMYTCVCVHIMYTCVYKVVVNHIIKLY